MKGGAPYPLCQECASLRKGDPNYDDNPLERLRVCDTCGHHSEGEEDYEGIWMLCHERSEGPELWKTPDVMPSDHCHFDPSRWIEQQMGTNGTQEPPAAV